MDNTIDLMGIKLFKIGNTAYWSLTAKTIEILRQHKNGNNIGVAKITIQR